jgi:hypothetical protein
MQLILISITVLAFSLPVLAQSESPVEALRQLDLKAVRVGVADPDPGEKSASSFTELPGGVTIDSITGCTVTLRNEQTGKGRKWIYYVVIPLNQLKSKGSLSQVAGATHISGDVSNIDFSGWRITYDVKTLRRLVTLHGPNSRSILARGAHVAFNVKEREQLDELNAVFTKVIDNCNAP